LLLLLLLAVFGTFIGVTDGRGLSVSSTQAMRVQRGDSDSDDGSGSDSDDDDDDDLSPSEYRSLSATHSCIIELRRRIAEAEERLEHWVRLPCAAVHEHHLP
jgi:hypothetical protein